MRRGGIGRNHGGNSRPYLPQNCDQSIKRLNLCRLIRMTILITDPRLPSIFKHFNGEKRMSHAAPFLQKKMTFPEVPQRSTATSATVGLERV